MKYASDNKLWASSFIAPELKEAMRRRHEEEKQKAMPDLDEQHTETVFKALGDSLSYKLPVTIKVFGLYADTDVSGMVTRIDTYRNRVQLDNASWINCREILEASIKD